VSDKYDTDQLGITFLDLAFKIIIFHLYSASQYIESIINLSHTRENGFEMRERETTAFQKT